MAGSLFFCPPAFAQSEEEMQVLRMFYKDEDLVVTATRSPKPLSQVAENISVITAEDIEKMNAHTVSEVLARVTGVFVDFQGQDFGSSATLIIQGSENRHVLVLLDGVPWNFMSDGSAETNSIPVKIIKRIEIIKGPASSSWGSSLGGVINIVIKDTKDTPGTSGSVSVSYGERDTQDSSLDISGKKGIFGYYLYAGRQDANGLRNDKYFEKDSLFSRFDILVHPDVKLTFTTGYSEPHINFGDTPSYSLTSTGVTRTFFTTSSLSARLTEEISLEASFYIFKQKFTQDNDVLDTGPLGNSGDSYQNNIYNEKTEGGSGKIVWTHDIHTLVFGTDISHGRLDQTIDAGQYLQSLGVPQMSRVHPGISKWAVFTNDTISIGKLSVTPGFRYDQNNVSGSFTSPSLGATYKLGNHTLLRASIAKGFTVPPLSFTSGGGLFLDPNPSLKPEKVWSYQAGVESWVGDYIRARAIAFHHDTKNALVKVLYASPSTGNDLYFNKGEIKRDGVEFDVETAPFFNVSVKTGFAFVHKRNYLEEATSEDNYACNIAVKYNDNKSLSAELAGHYIWWDLDASNMAKYDTFIWDFNLSREVYYTNKVNVDIFLTVHNLFNGSQYTFGDRKNPARWGEAGVRLLF